MTIFRSRGFDSLIGKGTVVDGYLSIPPGTTCLVEGEFLGKAIDSLRAGLNLSKKQDKTTLHVTGSVRPNGGEGLTINIPIVIVTGNLDCDEIKCDLLAVKKGAVLKAKRILYRKLMVEPESEIHGEMIYRSEPKVEAPKG